MSAPEHLEEHRSPLADKLGIVLLSAGGGEARQQLLDSAARETLNARALHDILQSEETSAS